MNLKLFNIRRRGQMALSMVLTILLFLLIMIPVIVLHVQNEGKWSVKEKKATAAFHLAEAGIDRAKWKLMESDAIWIASSTGTLQGYDFDKAYDDVGGGLYTVRISSDPTDPDRRIVESVGKDATGAEIRRIRAVLENKISADFATRAVNQVSNTGGNAHIEWGPVYSGNSIDATGRTYPRYFSAGHVSPQDGGSTTASTDNVYWWSYYPVPPMPKVKFADYLKAAQDAGASPCGGDYYTLGDKTFEGCTDLSGNTYYITGDVLFKAGGAGNHITGNIIVASGQIKFQGNGGTNNANGTYLANIPPDAWMEYGAAWDVYEGYDPAAPDTYEDAVSISYQASGQTKQLTGVLIHGFIYAGGGEALGGGGQGTLHGVLMVGSNATMTTSNFKIWYDNQVASNIKLQGLFIEMQSWYEVKGEWPSGV